MPSRESVLQAARGLQSYGRAPREVGILRHITDIAFALGIACLFTHELDAVPNHEWRGLPLLGALPDETGMAVFIAAHVPLFAVLIALVASLEPRTRALSRLGIAAFLLVHGLLHTLSSGRPDYEFASALSHALILGGAAFGALYLALEGKRRADGLR